GLERQRERRFPNLAAFREALLPLLPGQMTIAGLGLRVGAYLIDSLPFMVCGEVVGLSQINRGTLISPAVMFGVTVPYFLYLWLSEGLWGCSPGKWLLRLRVTRAGGWGRPGLWRALLRTAVFVGTGGLLSNLALYYMLDQADQFSWAQY